MQIKFNKSMNKRIISVELETTNFTHKENQLLDKFGEPKITINKRYKALFPVEFDRSIRTGFKVRIKFDGKENDIATASEAAEEFYEEVKELMAVAMEELSMKEFEVMYDNKDGLETIKY